MLEKKKEPKITTEQTELQAIFVMKGTINIIFLIFYFMIKVYKVSFIMQFFLQSLH
jgi:hypothetical protein